LPGTSRLSTEGYVVETAADGHDGYERALGGDFDLIILDLMLPRKNGLDVCRDLRHQELPTPILILTARGETMDKVIGLKLGADDYLVKPFEMAELLARIEALLRRSTRGSRSSEFFHAFGDIQVDFKSTEVRRAGNPVPVSAKEFQLLRFFIEHRGETLSRERLLEEVWGYATTPFTRTVDVHVAWLRQKLEEDSKQPRWIVTVHGLGYKFNG
jgi:two-component system alkaline phosphatase synthesis response regulator PhoP